MRDAILRLQRLGRSVCAIAGLCSVLISGVAIADSSTSSFSGYSAQGKSNPVSLTVNASRVGFNIRYVEKCYTPSGSSAGGSNGTFGFHTSAGVTLDNRGYFTHTAAFQHVATTGSPPQYFNSSDNVSGEIGGGVASGTFSFAGRFYDQNGVYMGSCETGVVTWSASTALGCHAAFAMPPGYGPSNFVYDAATVLTHKGMPCVAALHIAAKAYSLQGLHAIYGPQFGADGFGGPFHAGRFHCYLLSRGSDFRNATCSRDGQSVQFNDHRQYWYEHDPGWSPPPLNP